MKNSLIYSFLTLALAAGLAASCTREPMAESSGAPEQITATITQLAVGIEETTLGTDAPQTKTSTGAFDSEHKAQLTWSENDQITVTDAAGKTAVYTLDEDDGDEDLGPGKTEAKFTLTSAQTDFGTGPFTATYDSKPAAYQTITPGTSVPGGLYMEAAEVDNLRGFSFEVKCGLLSLKLTSATEKTVTQIVISGAPGEYTITPSGGSATVSTGGTTFVIPLMPGRYNEIKVYDNSTPVKVNVFKSGVSIPAGHLQPVTADLTTEAAVAHEYVNIGGQTWATMNIGATTVAGDLNTCAGDFYAWGSTNKIYESLTWTYPDTPNSYGFILPQPTIVWKTGYETGFSPANAPFYVSGDTNANTTFSKYYGDDALTQLLPEDDVATQTWGNDWRMPTSQDFETLYESCGAPKDTLGNFVELKDTLTVENKDTRGVYIVKKDQTVLPEYSGVLGVLFIQDASHKLFFPSAWAIVGTTPNNQNCSYSCFCWSSSLNLNETRNNGNYKGQAYNLQARKGSAKPNDDSNRRYGYTIRAIRNIPAPDDLPGTAW